MADNLNPQNLPDFSSIAEQLNSISENLSKITYHLSSAGDSIQDNTKKYNRFKKSVKDVLDNDIKYKENLEKISNILKLQESYKKREQKLNEENVKISENVKKINDLQSLSGKRKTQDVIEEIKRLKDLHKQLLANYKTEEDNLKKQKTLYDNSESELDLLRKKQLDIENKAEVRAERLNTAFTITSTIVSKIAQYGKQVLDTALQTESVTSKLAANYGLSQKEASKLKNNIAKASAYTAMIGVKTEDLVKMQSRYSDETGRSVVLSKENLRLMSDMSVATGLGVEETSGFMANMDLFGLSIASSSMMINDLINNAKKQGVSASVAAKKVNDNLKLANSYIFKNGVKGLMDMTSYAIKMRINMDEVAKLADKVSTPEGALETAAALQSLGGAYSSLSDPIQLLNESLNNMEGLTKRYEAMTTSMMKFSRETGEISFAGGSIDMMRAKEAAKAMGVSYDEMVKVARTKAKREAISQTITFNPQMNEDDKDLISSMAEFNKKSGKWEVSVYNKERDEYIAEEIGRLSKEQIASLRPTEVQIKDVARNTQGIHDMIQNFFDFLKKSFAYPVVKVLNQLQPVLTRIANFLGAPIEEKILGGNGSDIVGGGGIANVSSENGFSSIGASGSIANAVMKGKNIFTPNESVFQNSKAYGSVSKTIGKMLGGETGGNIAKYLSKNITNSLFKKLPLIGAAISTVSALSRLVEGDWQGSLIDLASGASTFIPVVGTAVGLGLDAWNLKRDIDKFSSPEDSIDDGIVRSNGSVVKINKQDDVLAVKKGGPIDSILSLNNNIDKNKYSNFNKNAVLDAYNKSKTINSIPVSNEKIMSPEALKMVSVINSNKVIQKQIETIQNTQPQGKNIKGSVEHIIKGEIRLTSNGSSAKIDVSELLKNPEFVKEITAAIANQLNRDNNGGVYSGNMNKYSMI